MRGDYLSRLAQRATGGGESELPVIRVTAEDLQTGDKTVKDISDDVVVITAGRHYVHHIAKHANGTQIWTIKVDNGGGV